MPTALEEKTLDKEPEISQLVNDCLKFEGNMGLGLAEMTLKELDWYLKELVGYCQSKGFYTPHSLNPQLLKDYVEGYRALRQSFHLLDLQTS